MTYERNAISQWNSVWRAIEREDAGKDAISKAHEKAERYKRQCAELNEPLALIDWYDGNLESIPQEEMVKIQRLAASIFEIRLVTKELPKNFLHIISVVFPHLKMLDVSGAEFSEKDVNTCLKIAGLQLLKTEECTSLSDEYRGTFIRAKQQIEYPVEVDGDWKVLIQSRMSSWKRAGSFSRASSSPKE